MTTYTLMIDEQTFAVEIGSIQGSLAQVTVNQVPYTVRMNEKGQVLPETVRPVVPEPEVREIRQAKAPSAPAGAENVAAPIPGKILSVLVAKGDKVLAGQVLAVIEAMKMENNIISPMDGTITDLKVVTGQDVATGDLILVVG